MNKNELISKVKELDALTLEEKSQLIDLINRKRYGLVWEDKPEDAEELLNEALPVLSEVKERAIIYKPETDEEQAPNHILIEGDNLHALTSLCFTHENKIDVIYIDPPYNTGNKDFRYYDSRYDEVREVDKENPFRHSMWLSFIGKRLRLAKRLLKDTGVIFISIDDNEQSQLKLLCDEIFGETNFITQCVLINNIAGRSDKKHIALSHEYVLVYQKSNLFESTGIELNESLLSEYKFEDKNGKYRLQGLRKRGANSRREDRPNLYYSIFYSPSLNEVSLEKKDGFIEVLPKLSDGADGNWRWGKNTLLEKKDRLLVKLSNKKYEVFEKVYLFDEFGSTKTTKLKSFLFDSDYTTDTATSYFKEIVPSSNFNNPKSPFLIKDLLKISTPNKKEIVLDFFAGSGTTLNATLLLNKSDNGTRQCILVTNNENNICEEVTYLRNKKVIEGYTEGDEGRAKKMSEIVQLLKNYGAKSLSEIYTNTLEDFLEIFATSATGLVTKGGNIKIEDIPNIDSALAKEFKEWVTNNPDKLDEYKRDFVGKITNPPDAILLQQHNEHGLSLAKKIQQLTGRNIIVNYLKVNPETFEKQNFRMVETVEM